MDDNVFLPVEELRFHAAGDARAHLEIKGDRTVFFFSAARTYPYAWPEDYIALLDSRGFREARHGQAGHYVIERAFVES